MLQQLHSNRTFWVLAATERPDHFSGRSKVARRSQPCVKWALVNKGPESMPSGAGGHTLGLTNAPLVANTKVTRVG